MSSLKFVIILVQYHLRELVQRIFHCGDMQYTSLTLDKQLNNLIYRLPLSVIIYRSYNFLKTVQFLDHSVVL